MGVKRSREPQGAPAFNTDIRFTSTGALIVNRLVKLSSGGGVKHTTGTSGRAGLGVALAAATGSGKVVPIRVGGIVDCEASTGAVKKGALLRATSGAASTASRLGGTLKASTSAIPNIFGIALTSAAAGAGKRLISVLIDRGINLGLLT